MPVLLEQTAANDPKQIPTTGEEVLRGRGRGAVWPLLASLGSHQSPHATEATTGFFVLCSPWFSGGANGKNYLIHSRAVRINEGSWAKQDLALVQKVLHKHRGLE